MITSLAVLYCFGNCFLNLPWLAQWASLVPYHCDKSASLSFKGQRCWQVHCQNKDCEGVFLPLCVCLEDLEKYTCGVFKIPLFNKYPAWICTRCERITILASVGPWCCVCDAFAICGWVVAADTTALKCSRVPRCCRNLLYWKKMWLPSSSLVPFWHAQPKTECSCSTDTVWSVT